MTIPEVTLLRIDQLANNVIPRMAKIEENNNFFNLFLDYYV